jgi:poly(hydroxyalkanoate) depolymerase family esterase
MQFKAKGMAAWPTIGGFVPAAAPPPQARPLVTFGFAPNPGSLVAKKFVPEGLPDAAPLVVVLHGCTQTPEDYDRGTGWTYLAARHGFAVLFAQQSQGNNMNRCFNWFEPGDMQRGAGEPASIKAMIDTIVADHAIDRTRIHITGLSAGAAMAGVMLATYPDLFAGGGLIAGLPYGVATSVPAALSRMRSRGGETDVQLGGLVQQASAHGGPWPTVSIWHGDADATVNAANATATVGQWRAVHGLDRAAPVEERMAGHTRRVWRDAAGRDCVEEYVIAGMGHGTPLDSGHPGNSETAGAYLIDVGLSSTLRLAASWGLIDGVAESVAAAAPQEPTAKVAPAKVMAEASPAEVAAPKVVGAGPVMMGPLKLGPLKIAPAKVRSNVEKVITDALKSAGLMR